MPKWLSWLGFTLASPVQFVFREALDQKMLDINNMCGFGNQLSAQDKDVIISWSFMDRVAIVFMKMEVLPNESCPELVEEHDKCCLKSSYIVSSMKKKIWGLYKGNRSVTESLYKVFNAFYVLPTDCLRYDSSKSHPVNTVTWLSFWCATEGTTVCVRSSSCANGISAK